MTWQTHENKNNGRNDKIYITVAINLNFAKTKEDGIQHGVGTMQRQIVRRPRLSYDKSQFIPKHFPVR